MEKESESLNHKVIVNRIESLGAEKGRYLIALILLLLGGLLMFTNMYVVNYEIRIGYEALNNMRLKMSMFEIEKSIAFVFALGYVIAALAAAYPVLSGKWDIKYYKAARCVPVAALVLFMLAYLGSYEMAELVICKDAMKQVAGVTSSVMNSSSFLSGLNGEGLVNYMMQYISLNILSAKLTFGGWIFLVDSFAALILLRNS